MEVLAARSRLGEPSWPFKNEHSRAARGLVARGLIDVWGDVTQGSFRAALTTAGRKMYLSETYEAPVNHG